MLFTKHTAYAHIHQLHSVCMTYRDIRGPRTQAFFELLADPPGVFVVQPLMTVAPLPL